MGACHGIMQLFPEKFNLIEPGMLSRLKQDFELWIAF